MHIYHLGLSSISLPPSEVAMADAFNGISGDTRQQQQQQQQPEQHKRSHLPTSTSPSFRMDDDVGTLDAQASCQDHMVTPATKRQRQASPERSYGNSDILFARGGMVTPEDHRPAPTVEKVNMERDDQYDWWKKPPAAPQLLESVTMHPSIYTDHVVGCYSCQRLFVPPKSKPTARTTSQATLLNYFPSNKPTAERPTPGVLQFDLSACCCTFCERSTCPSCLRHCEQCDHRFCILCSTLTYLPSDPRYEQTLCLDCASMLDIPQAREDAMMEG